MRITSIIVFLVIIAGAYYYFVVDKDRVNRMVELDTQDEVLTQDVNSSTLKYGDLELRFIGHGKHLQTMQIELDAHKKAYFSRMDSIDMVFEEVKYLIEDLETRFTKKFNRLSDDLRNLSDGFDSYKRKTKRDLRELNQDVSALKDEVNELSSDMVLVRQKLKLNKDEDD